MSTNPLGAYTGGQDDENGPSDNSDGGELAQCEQKIADLETRVSAIEEKLGMGASGPAKAPMITKKPGGKLPFFGG